MKNKITKIANDEIYEKVSEELNEPLHLVKEIAQFQNKFIKNTIEQGLFETVQIPYIGKFTPSFRKLQYKSNINKDE